MATELHVEPYYQWNAADPPGHGKVNIAGLAGSGDERGQDESREGSCPPAVGNRNDCVGCRTP